MTILSSAANLRANDDRPCMADKYTYDHPDKPGVKISRQRRWQILKRKKGKCPRCGGNRPKHKKGFCRKCDTKAGLGKREAS